MTSSTVSSLIFVDSSVDDYQRLIQGASANARIVILDPTQDGIEQISQALSGYGGLESIQIVSHGSDGLLQLGATQLSAGNLSYYAAQIQSWSDALADDADLLLYGCNVASGEAGQAFVQQLSQLTGAEVAASNDLTGSGGDWELEYTTGAIETASVLDIKALAAYQGTLVSVSNDAQLRQAIEDANSAGENVEIYINGKIVLVDELPDITGNITFIGTSSAEINGNKLYQVFRVNGASAKVTFNGLTIADGRVTGSAGTNSSTGNGGIGGVAYGAGLFINQGDVTLVNVTFKNNQAIGGKGGTGSTATGGNGGNAHGGAIYISGGSLLISKSSFLDNVAQAGTGGAGKPNGKTGEGRGGAFYVAGGTVTTEGTPGYTGNKATTSNVNDFGTVTVVTSPTVTVSLLDTVDTAAQTVRYALTFDRDVTGVDSEDFVVITDGDIIDAQVSSVTGSGKEYIVEVLTGTGNGTLKLKLADNDSIKNGNVPLGGTGTGDDVISAAYTINKTPPTIASIKPKTAVLTAASSVVFTVIFNESITGVDVADFVLASEEIKDAKITSVQKVGIDDTVYEVTVNTGTGNGNLGLNLVDNNSIKNLRGVDLGGAAVGDGNFTGETYEIDKTPPSVASINRSDTNPTNKGSVSYEVKFSEDVTGVDLTDFSLVTSGVKGASLSSVEKIDAKTYKVLVNTGSEDGSVRLDLKDNDSIKDLLSVALGDSNGGTNGNFTGQTYTLLKNSPRVAAINTSDINPTAAGTLEYLVTFTQSVTGVDTSDFSLASTGITGAQVTSVVKDDDSNYIVRVSTGTGNGNLRLNLIDNDSIKNALNVSLGGQGTRNGDFSGQVYTINKTPPRVTAINRLDANPTNAETVTFTAIFNENVNFVDATDFTLVTNGVTGARISSVKRVNGSFYELEVNTGNGNGTIGLSLKDNDTIINERGAILGGIGLSNGNFTGEVYQIDKTNPTANIVDVSPNPRRDKVSAVTIDFNEAVRGLDLADLRLTHDGKLVDLSKASLTTKDSKSWTLGNIKRSTNQKGEYVLSIAAGDSGIVDVAGNPLTTNLIERWTNLETVEACDPGIFRRGTNAADVLTGTADKDTLMGSDGNDILLGLDCGDRLVGDRGNDVINGGEGNDLLVGGVGNDLLIGGIGQDILKGGPDKDRFVFSGTSQADALSTSLVDAPDRIQDFKFSRKDKFQLDFDNNLGSKNRPRGLFQAGKVGGGSLSAAVKAAYADKNQEAAGNQGLKANEAVFFKWKNRTYLSVNDNSSGFATDRDLVVSVGIQFKSGDADAGVLSVSNYFI